MLEKVSLKRSLEKAEYKAELSRLQERLRVLQRAVFEAQVAVTVVLEGWDASGKGTLVSKLVEKLDPRGFRVRPTYAPTPEELYRPWLWRFWLRLPPRGEIAVFDRSWYGRVLVERIEKLASKPLVEQAFTEIRELERQMVDDGQVLVKLFLHISKKEQKKRFRKCEADEFLRWKIKPEDWRHHDQYAQYLKATEEMLEATSTAEAPWTIVPATDKRYSEVECFRAIAAAVERRLKAVHKLPPPNATIGNLAAKPKGAAKAPPAARKSSARRPHRAKRKEAARA